MQGTDRVQVVLKVGQDADVEGWNPLFVHYILAFEERSAQLLKLLQTFCHVTDLHSVTDGLNDVGQFLKPVNQVRDIKRQFGEFLDMLLEKEPKTHPPFIFGAAHHSLGILFIIAEKQGPVGERIGEAQNKKLEIVIMSDRLWICIVLTA